MKTIPFIMLGFDPEDWIRRLGSGRYGALVLVGVMLLIMLCVGLIAYAWYRVGRRRQHHRHHHHHSYDAGASARREEQEESEGHHRRRHRRRRREHRPRNPTLAETGGLPPIRRDGPGPAP